ncbi:MAG: glutamate--tRNA ligase [Limnochordia bacterium]|jgi:nondiscriminating glutamyl-tRNA synthetase
MSKVRVRFAPSPTGFLHVGGARTALYNWLFARHHGGTFVLRIEDTDLARSTEESVRGILDGMRFLGLDWDEGPEVGGEYGPYFQTERLELYHKYVQQLMEVGRAYECFCTPEELEAQRQAQREQKLDIHYDGRCRHLTEEQKAAYRAEGRKPVVRFVSEKEGQTEIPDLIRGSVVFQNSQIDDFVIVKSDGVPTYNYAVVIDDALMEITHVVRGEDHIPNTPKQIQLYKALGFPIPEFAHIPMILGSDKTRLSKRHGATSVMQFHDEGYLADAMVNYLALLGWGYDDSQTLFSRDELIEKFSLERVSKNPAVFDFQKLQWMNGVYIRELTLDEFYDHAFPHLQKAGLVPAEPSEEEQQLIKTVLKELQSRVKLISEVVEMSRYFFTDDFPYNEEAVRKVLGKGDAKGVLEYLRAALASVSSFSHEELEPVFNGAMEEFDLKLGKVIQPLRVAVTGTNVSPGIYEVLEIVGQQRTLARIDRALDWIAQGE